MASPRESRGWDWRAAVDAAIAEGRAAAAELSARDLKALLALPPEKRKSALDADDLRARNLLPADKARLRESCVPARPGSIDPAAQAAARLAERKHKIAVLMEYVATYEAQLDAAGTALGFALDRMFRDGEAIAERVLFDLQVGCPEHIYRSVFVGKYGSCRWWVSDAARQAAHAALREVSEIARLRLAALAEVDELQMNGEK